MQFSRVALFLVLLLITQYLLAEASADQRQKRRKGKGQGRKPETAPTVRAEEKKAEEKKPPVNSDAKRKPRGSAPKQGKFVGRDKAQCKWTLRGEEAADMNLRLECKEELKNYWCEFTGKPSACPKYTGDAKTYWKQITRTLKKQKAVCSDPSAVLKSGLCKSTKAAHLKLTSSSLLAAAVPGEKQSKAAASLTAADPDKSDVNKIADENCSQKWGSLCKFMLAAFQG